MSKEKLFQERVDRISKAFKHETPDRVPIALMIETWAGHYSGHNIVDLGYDYPKLRESFLKVADDFEEIDALPPAFGVRPGNLYAATQSREFSYYDAEGNPYASVQHIEAGGVMTEDEYPELIADPFKFIMEKQLPRRYAAFDKPPTERALAYGQAAIVYKNYIQGAIAMLGEQLAVEKGLPCLFKGSTEMPMDVLMDYFRGFKGVSTDIRRHKNQVIEACKALYPLMIKRAIHGIEKGIFPGIFIPLHIPTYLRPKDFETFYWPTFKKMIDTMVENECTPILFMEGNWEPYYDFINDLPKKKVVGLVESGDFKKMKDAVGDTICIMGGMPVDVINHSTKDEVVKYTEKLIDDLAPGGGYIFALDKVLIAPNDANPENLKAALQTVAKYGQYK
ncbi:MAG: uroporphyrinogen decarboxylase family protein [Anaerovoracaceae bacterium]|jgi:uroporphyrinogen-III decarboxylase